MSDNPQKRRLQNTRRPGTGRTTTERRTLKPNVLKGKRTGLEIDFEKTETVFGFQLPGAFFDTLDIPSKYSEESSDFPSSQSGF
jgi:hypothetical protein